MTKPRPRVVLLVQSSRSYGRGLLRGISDYIRQAGPWAIYHQSGGLPTELPPWLRGWRPDGIIGQFEGVRLLRQVRRLGVPAVDVLALHRSKGIPRLVDDNEAVARMIADHFLARGYRNFAYCGVEGVFYCQQRCQALNGILAKHGYTLSVYQSPVSRQVSGVMNLEAAAHLDIEQIGAWLASLPRPLCLMTGSDIRAQQVLSACRDREIAVPQEVAVIGVGNDEVICDLCDPLLSSVQLNNRKIGFEAAALLDRMMRGTAETVEEVRFPPVAIVTRDSTDATAVADDDLAAALQYIRANYWKGISVEDVAQQVALSRSTLQRRFAAILHRSPRDEIVRLQVLRIKELLVGSDLPLRQIAERVGFTHLESMCKLFRHQTGQTPGAFRRNTRTA